MQRDTDLGLNFAPVVFYDGQGFMVPKKLGVKSAKELNGATICVQPGTTTELNLADYFRANKMEFKPVVIEKLDEALNAFFSGRCDVYTTDCLGARRQPAEPAPNPDDYVILPEVISKEPLAPAVRQGDDQWNDIVRWVIYALIEAEEKGITQKNVDDMAKSDDPTSSACSASPRAWERPSGSTRNGPITRSRPSAITARSSTAMSARIADSNSIAGPTICGPRAA